MCFFIRVSNSIRIVCPTQKSPHGIVAEFANKDLRVKFFPLNYPVSFEIMEFKLLLMRIFPGRFHCNNCCNNCNTRVGISSKLATRLTNKEDLNKNHTNPNGRKIFSLVLTVAFICLMTAAIIPGVMGAELDVNLNSASNFAILSYSGITDANPGLSVISGDIGSSPITGASMSTITCTEMSGYSIYGVDATIATACYHGTPADKTLVDLAFADSVTAYGDASGRTTAPVTELGAGNVGGLTLAPGLYKWTTNVDVGTGTDLTFDAGGDPTAVWILQTTGMLNMAANTHMVLSNGARAEHIYWQVAGIPGANINAGAHAEGNILAAGAINLLSGASLNDRAFSQAAAAGVTLSGNTLTRADLVPPRSWLPYSSHPRPTQPELLSLSPLTKQCQARLEKRLSSITRLAASALKPSVQPLSMQPPVQKLTLQHPAHRLRSAMWLPLAIPQKQLHQQTPEYWQRS
jgi:hypothetical protein